MIPHPFGMNQGGRVEGPTERSDAADDGGDDPAIQYPGDLCDAL